MNKPQLWTKNFLIISMANFVLYFTFYLLMVVITLFATEKFHASPSQAGLASGLFVVGTLISRIFSGRYIDEIGYKKMLYVGFTLFLITTCFYIFTNSMTLLLINRLLNGAAMGVASTSTGAIVAKIIPNERRGEGTGYYALSLTVAAAFGPFLGMFITGHAPFYMNFIICIALLALSFIAIFFIEIPKVEFKKAEDKENKEGFSLHNFFEVKAIPISIISAIIALGYSSILSFITSYAKEINLMNIGSFFFIIYAICVLISRPFTGKWFDKRGENFVMYPAIILFAISLFTLSKVSNGFILLLAGILLGLGYGTTSASAQAIAIKVAPKHRMSLATSTNFIFQDLGVGIGPFILGSFVPIIGYTGLYIMMAIIIFLCVILYYILHGRKNDSNILI